MTGLDHNNLFSVHSLSQEPRLDHFFGGIKPIRDSRSVISLPSNMHGRLVQPTSPTSRLMTQRVELSEGDDIFSAQNIRVVTYQEWRAQRLDALKDTLILDLSTPGYEFGSACNQIQLSFPSTLLRRPSFTFEKLMGTLNDCTRERLIKQLASCTRILIFDDGSLFMTSCFYSTVAVIRKLVDYLSKQKGPKATDIYLLQNGTRSMQHEQRQHHYVSPTLTSPTQANNNTSHVQHPVANNTRTENSGKPKISLRLHIPRHDETTKYTAIPTTSTKGRCADITGTKSSELFIQSMKGDTLHYSPESLYKYFRYRTPSKLPRCVPQWFHPFNRTGDQILLELLAKFELLELLEVKRLRKCIAPNDSNSFSRSSTVKTRLYSLKELEKQYVPSHKLQSETEENKDLTTDRYSDEDTYTSIQNNGFNWDNNNTCDIEDCESDLIPENTICSHSNGTSVSERTRVQDEEVLETPLDEYGISQGINSFTKNRYSNIIPYEHTRVKLEPSPLHHEPSQRINPQSALPYQSTVESKGSDKMVEHLKVPISSSYFSNAFEHNSEKYPDTSSCEPFNDYFNANYLNLPEINPSCRYIATQAPLLSTIDDFWKVVTTNDVQVIISLNSDDELNLRKWDIYWKPDSMRKYDITILNCFEDLPNLDGIIIREFQVRKKQTVVSSDSDDDSNISCKTHNVYQIQYTKWLDSCGIVMSDFLQLYRIKNALVHQPEILIEKLRSHVPGSKQPISLDNLTTEDTFLGTEIMSPLLVHCSAGCGRTGVFITLDFLLTILQPPYQKMNKIDVWKMNEDLIFIVVNEFRKQRISMVQNLTQYITCYESLLEFFAINDGQANT
ncbi:HHL040Cp [Eremothecium sinecaudum]|uniref:HHL040Cp n=1 Tax=Eremothecium sinecaudum TaxID=45286 RepID=A0A0X8HWJ6_9SACH|nr:HHL040Cp [Eremothecium sinecaudum]AMD22730.1 HHL040Cp [Eremothecium sinecaudum]